MTPFNGIPRKIEQELEQSNANPSRRQFLRNAGMFAVTFSAADKFYDGTSTASVSACVIATAESLLKRPTLKV